MAGGRTVVDEAFKSSLGGVNHLVLVAREARPVERALNFHLDFAVARSARAREEGLRFVDFIRHTATIRTLLAERLKYVRGELIAEANLAVSKAKLN
ncbi:hypothetical protein HG530_013005 [Fusarium avenaceum]|nr:hypothetical protein HG530_013005 [Fusarium avenaceum]